MTNKNQEQIKKWEQLVVKCWSDDALKNRLLANPAAVLREAGLEVPAGQIVKVVVNTATETYLVLPARPADLPDEELDKVAGGDASRTFAMCVGMFR